MSTRDISSSYRLDTATNRFLDDFPVHCHYREGAMRQNQMHAHRGYELYYCVEGHGMLLVGDRVILSCPEPSPS
ncbi:hypothetical protein [Cohnella herbarum]|uniref:AraC family transcriptional regulator n=1 Tax=Cohnella herbarum TaxID=2728023 RepID=A0A7Z2VF34_9BACL|nr:hypothetical protein [Cohnella herbarum]QJD81735.1 hypothetical protein HH215_00080 [Cohnella herbarum]